MTKMAPISKAILPPLPGAQRPKQKHAPQRRHVYTKSRQNSAACAPKKINNNLSSAMHTKTALPIHYARSEHERIARLIARLQQQYAVSPAMIRVVRAPLR